MSEVPVRAEPIRRRWLTLILLIGVVGLIAGWLARAWLIDFADLKHIDSSPRPRPRNNAPFIKSAEPVVDKMIEVGEITDQDLVYDLGCGDGRIVITAAVQRGCRGVGFDIDPQRVEEATENAKQHGVENLVRFKQEDIFNVDLSDANVLVMYLLPRMMQDLVPQFDRCPPGTRIVSHDWKIDDVQEEKRIEVPVSETDTHFVFLYVTPLKKLPPSPKLPSVIK